MRICMLSDLETQGGAAIAASRLAQGLSEAGHEVTRIVAEPDGASHPWRTARLVPTRQRWLRGVFALSRNPNLSPALVEALLDPAYQRLVSGQLRRLLAEMRPQVINAHNLHAARWGPQVIAEAARWAPVVWTLHDTWSFTGRCCVESSCHLFAEGCDSSCPSADAYPRLARWCIAGAWRKRQELLRSLPDLVAVTPSAWLASYAREGLWQHHRVEVIHNGLDLRVFKPVPKSVARAALDLPSDRPLLIMSAGGLNDPKKGGGLLREALEQVATPLTLLLLGEGGGAWSLRNGHRSVALGFVSHPRLLALLYSAADLIVHPTLADNAPLVLQEAIACGTPCVCTPVGGCPEMVRPGESGWGAAETSAPALAEAIEQALADLRAGADLAESCRALAEREYSLHVCVQRYADCFKSLDAAGLQR